MDLAALWETLKEVHKNQGAEAAAAYYDEELWPRTVQAWRDLPAPAAYQISVHTLGTSPEAVILAALKLKAADIYVLYTEQTASYLERLERELARNVNKRKVSRSDPADIYAVFRDILRNYPQASIAVDLTSGTKPMVSGLGAAAFAAKALGYKTDVYYVDGEYDSALRRPKAGTERLISLADPLGAFGDLEYQTAKALYEQGNFEGAARVFERIADLTGDQRRFSPYAELSRVYAPWYTNRFREARQALATLFETLKKPGYHRHSLQEQMPVLLRQAEGLDVLGKVADAYTDDTERLRMLADTETILWLLNSIGVMQERFTEAGNHTAAGLLCYRGLEVTSQHRLACANFDSLQADYMRLPLQEEALSTAYTNAWRSIQSKKQAEQERMLPQAGEPVPLLEGYMLLAAIGDALVKQPASLRNVMGLAELRNTSLWIHGYSPISADDSSKLSKLFKHLLGELEALEANGRTFPAEPVALP